MHTGMEMNIENFNNALASKFGCRFSKEPTYSSEWNRIFILMKQKNSNIPVSLGRASFKNGKLEYFKYYKPFEYPLGPEDRIMIRLMFFLETNIYIPTEAYDHFVLEAKLKHRNNLEAKQNWRKNNPTPLKTRIINGKITTHRRSRGRIQGRSENSFLMELLKEHYKEEENEDKKYK